MSCCVKILKVKRPLIICEINVWESMIAMRCMYSINVENANPSGQAHILSATAQMEFNPN